MTGKAWETVLVLNHLGCLNPTAWNTRRGTRVEIYMQPHEELNADM